MRVLVSVRDLVEARLVARAGVSFIDLKEPNDGALGGLDVDTIRVIVAMLRMATDGTPFARPISATVTARFAPQISATIGDWPAHDLGAIRARVRAVAACGVDLVKVGLDPATGSAIELLALADDLAALQAAGIAIVPVLIADTLDQHAVTPDLLQRLAVAGHPAVMLDTADKRGGSLLQRVAAPLLRAWVATLRQRGALVGLAGALRLDDLPALRDLAPDFAGFRSAVCAGDRRLCLDAERLDALLQALTQCLTPESPAAPPQAVPLQLP